jgi:CheY-like chemotaxis protein
MGEDPKKLHVLVVDDEAVTRDVVCRMLKNLGHKTIAARNAREALECLSNDGDLNFLLTDINMPDMDGWELALRVKAAHPCMRIAAITGEDPGSILPRLNGSGISQALFKPLNATLEQRVAERTRLAERRAKEVQSLAVELIDAEERERQRIADIPHDDLQQILACACMQLRTAGERTPGDPVIHAVSAMLADAMNKSRRLSHELSPVILRQSGLDAGIRRLAGQMTDWFGLNVRLELDPVPAMKSELLKEKESIEPPATGTSCDSLERALHSITAPMTRHLT